jgi:hypothetical protein
LIFTSIDEVASITTSVTILGNNSNIWCTNENDGIAILGMSEEGRKKKN